MLLLSLLMLLMLLVEVVLLLLPAPRRVLRRHLRVRLRHRLSDGCRVRLVDGIKPSKRRCARNRLLGRVHGRRRRQVGPREKGRYASAQALKGMQGHAHTPRRDASAELPLRRSRRHLRALSTTRGARQESTCTLAKMTSCRISTVDV
jgi:hypothetical protein